MEQSNFDMVLKALSNNHPCYDEEGQKRDVDLICNLLQLKYNSIELKNISQLLIQKITDCIDKKTSWFCNY